MRIENALRTAAVSDRSWERAKRDNAEQAGLSFAEVLKNAAEQPLPTKRSPLAGLREDPRGEAVGRTEKEDKYCSLCGSMIDKDGSCPLCGVPLFLSGKPGGGSAPRTAQTDPTETSATGFINTRGSFSRAASSKDE